MLILPRVEHALLCRYWSWFVSPTPGWITTMAIKITPSMPMMAPGKRSSMLIAIRLDAIPTSRIAISIELLLPGAIIGIEGVILIAIVAIHPGIGNTNQLQYLQGRACPTLGSISTSTRCILVRTLALYQVCGRTPDIHRHALGWSLGIQGFVDFRIIDEFTSGAGQAALGNR